LPGYLTRVQRYLIALGSNVRHHRYGSPQAVLGAALSALEDAGLRLERASRVISTAPLGPSRRRYANAAAIVATDLAPDALLRRLKRLELRFGRRAGRRWAPRVLDLDIVLWDGGAWCSPGLTVPHVAFRERRFVLEPAATIAPGWRDPLTGRTVRQLAGRRYTF
jgi:2-amino-4-hydroxy-6-hydroxymethyldihydropteridine diphosphokinase